MLEIKNLDVAFKNQKVLENLSLKVNVDEIIGILGKNGAGKSTLFNSIYNNVRFQGEILLNEKPIEKKDIGPAKGFFTESKLYKSYLQYAQKRKLWSLRSNVLLKTSLFSLDHFCKTARYETNTVRFQI